MAKTDTGSLDAFFERIEKAAASLKLANGEECFYRGHADATWPLQPTLLRHAERKNWDWEKLRDVEADLYWEFSSRARDLHGRNLSDWDVLFYMREHGVATRLLDWSETLAVALHFALGGSSNGTAPCIWLLNAYALNEKSWELRDLLAPQYLSSANDDEDEYSDIMSGYATDFGWDKPVALYPMRRNERLHVQRGYFTIHGTDRRPLDVSAKKCVERVDILPAEISVLRRFLDRAGIDEFTLFPDLDTLGRYLHHKLGLI